jgi:hypothetical protein
MLRPYENEIRDYTERARIAMMIKHKNSSIGERTAWRHQLNQGQKKDKKTQQQWRGT